MRSHILGFWWWRIIGIATDIAVVIVLCQLLLTHHLRITSERLKSLKDKSYLFNMLRTQIILSATRIILRIRFRLKYSLSLVSTTIPPRGGLKA
jgi:hypothetical protein